MGNNRKRGPVIPSYDWATDAAEAASAAAKDIAAKLDGKKMHYIIAVGFDGSPVNHVVTSTDNQDIINSLQGAIDIHSGFAETFSEDEEDDHDS